jgi:hypothetical protein
VVSAPIAVDRFRFVISSVTIPKKPSSKKTIRDKNNFTTTARPGQHITGHRTGHRITGPDIARHCKRTLQAIVSSVRLKKADDMRATWQAGDLNKRFKQALRHSSARHGWQCKRTIEANV